MVRAQRSKGSERHSAAWGKRLSLVLLLLLMGVAYSRASDDDDGSGKLSAEVKRAMRHHSKNPVNVIVQYNQIASDGALSRVQGLGGHLSNRLDMVKGAAFSVPASALEGLANDPKWPT
jgi:hypothetical protein